jgi:hypothetical protein
VIDNQSLIQQVQKTHRNIINIDAPFHYEGMCGWSTRVIPGFSEIRVARSLIFSFLCFCRSLHVLLIIVFSVLVRLTASDDPFVYSIFLRECLAPFTKLF